MTDQDKLIQDSINFCKMTLAIAGNGHDYTYTMPRFETRDPLQECLSWQEQVNPSPSLAEVLSSFKEKLYFLVRRFEGRVQPKHPYCLVGGSLHKEEKSYYLPYRQL